MTFIAPWLILTDKPIFTWSFQALIDIQDKADYSVKNIGILQDVRPMFLVMTVYDTQPEAKFLCQSFETIDAATSTTKKHTQQKVCALDYRLVK